MSTNHTQNEMELSNEWIEKLSGCPLIISEKYPCFCQAENDCSIVFWRDEHFTKCLPGTELSTAIAHLVKANREKQKLIIALRWQLTKAQQDLTEVRQLSPKWSLHGRTQGQKSNHRPFPKLSYILSSLKRS
jgi:hypothetical protein